MAACSSWRSAPRDAAPGLPLPRPSGHPQRPLWGPRARTWLAAWWMSRAQPLGAGKKGRACKPAAMWDEGFRQGFPSRQWRGRVLFQQRLSDSPLVPLPALRFHILPSQSPAIAAARFRIACPHPQPHKPAPASSSRPPPAQHFLARPITMQSARLLTGLRGGAWRPHAAVRGGHVAQATLMAAWAQAAAAAAPALLIAGP